MGRLALNGDDTATFVPVIADAPGEAGTRSTAAMSAVIEIELACMDGVEAAGTLQLGEEKMFRRERDASSAESFAELKPQVVLMSVY
jgi:hypothetical protein